MANPETTPLPTSRSLSIFQLQNNLSLNSSDLGEQIAFALENAGHRVTTAFLKAREDDNTTATPQTAENTRPTSQASEVLCFGFTKKELKGNRLKQLFFFRKLFREKHYEAVIAHRFKPIILMLMLNRLLTLGKVVGVVHGFGDYDRPYRQWMVRLLCKTNCQFVAVSEPVRQYLLKLGCGFTEHNTLTINNAIDIAHVEALHLDRDNARQALQLPADKLVIGTIGRTVPVKDHRTLIQSVALLAKKYPNILGVIIGGGRLEDELRQQIKELGLEQHFVITGETPEAAKYVRAFDIFTLTSLSEGLPLALLEGMTGHLPVVGSDIPSIKWILEKIGRIYPVGNAEALASELEHFIQLDDASRKALGEAHYQFVCEQHNIDDFRNNYAALFELDETDTP